VFVLTRFSVSETDSGQFADQATDALAAFADCPGYLRGHLGREVDDTASWLLLTEWEGVGAYRRALSRYEVRVRAIPLLARGHPEPGAYEVLSTIGPAGTKIIANRSDRAANADTAHPGDVDLAAADLQENSLDQSPAARGAAPQRPGDPLEQETS
jgi:hypothetical protein